jgi:hypothetical protein
MDLSEQESGLRFQKPRAFVELILPAHPRIGRLLGSRNDLRMLATPGLRHGQTCSAARKLLVFTFIPGP